MTALNPYCNSVGSTAILISLMLQARKQKFREVEGLPEGHTAETGEELDPNQGLPVRIPRPSHHSTCEDRGARPSSGSTGSSRLGTQGELKG